MTAAPSEQLATEPATTRGPHPGRPPYEWYTSTELLEIERRHVFDKSWALVGTADDLPEPGSYLTVTIGTSPIVVLRDKDGVIRAFHNLCRHRGLPLLEERARCAGHIICPYHQWSYDLTGNLCRVPQLENQFEGMDLNDWGLHPAAVDIWQGMVFVNPEPTTERLDEAMAGLAKRLDPFLDGPLAEVARVSYRANCNWKLLVENHIDVYHLWYLHSRSLAMYDHRSFEWETQSNNWWSYEPLKDPAGVPEPAIGWLNQTEREGIGAHLLFPNLMLVTTGSYFATYDAVPTAPDQTVLTLRIRAEAGADAEALVAEVRSFMAEDVAVCELLQKGASSSRFSTGPLASSHEAPIRNFHRALAALCDV